MVAFHCPSRKVVQRYWSKSVAGCSSACRVYISSVRSDVSGASYRIPGYEPTDFVTSIANMTPSASRQQFGKLDFMTRVADEAVEARRLGKRKPFTQHNL